MRIQGKRVWIAGQFMAAQLVLEDGIIRQVLPYGSEPADHDYGDHRIVPGSVSYTHLTLPTNSRV